MSVKVEIFSGFLGAGKTQLIKKLIEEGYYKDKIAIIENEFGEVSIDGEVLKRTNTLVKETPTDTVMPSSDLTFSFIKYAIFSPSP